MNNVRLFVAEKMFQNKILSLSGSAFEEFFSQIMFKFDSRFIQVKPQWSKWDRKNDGFIKEEWHYFQVYSPENPEKNDSSWANKAINDFDWLFNFWNAQCKIKKYSFVFNDKKRWVYPDIQSALFKLEQRYPDIEFEFFHTNLLEKIFLELPERDKISIIWFIPSVDPFELSYEALSDFISNFNSILHDYEDNLVVPDFNEKILFNWLTDRTKNILEKAWYDIWWLEIFFNQNSNKNLRNILKDILKIQYEAWLAKWLEWDDLFFYIYNNIKTPRPINKPISDTIFILMSYYFESCDIFKEPK